VSGAGSEIRYVTKKRHAAQGTRAPGRSSPEATGAPRSLRKARPTAVTPPAASASPRQRAEDGRDFLPPQEGPSGRCVRSEGLGEGRRARTRGRWRPPCSEDGSTGMSRRGQSRQELSGEQCQNRAGQAGGPAAQPSCR